MKKLTSELDSTTTTTTTATTTTTTYVVTEPQAVSSITEAVEDVQVDYQYEPKDSVGQVALKS